MTNKYLELQTQGLKKACLNDIYRYYYTFFFLYSAGDMPVVLRKAE